jgi:TolB-like protein
MKKISCGIVITIMLIMACASSPAANTGGMTLDQAIAEAATRIDERIETGSKIALLNFSSPSDRFSMYVLDELTTNLLVSRSLTVVDRREVDLIRSEFDFQFSGEVGDDSMQALGQMLGAQSIVTGSLTEIGGDYRVVIRVLNVQSAAIEVQYRADIRNDRRVQSLLEGARTVTTTNQQRTTGGGAAQSAQTQGTTVQLESSAISIEVTARSSGTLFFQNERVATLWDNDTHTIPIENPGTYVLRMVFATHEETRSVVVSTRGITRVTFGQVYTIGQTGPAGGLVFYDKGHYSDGWRYLEAHSGDFTGVQWGARDIVIGGTMAGIGDGKRNTELVVTRLNRTGEQNRAAQLAASLNAGGFNDWYLPSRDELDLMYKNLKLQGRGNFSDGWYWSSSESTTWDAWVQHFGGGWQRSESFLQEANKKDSSNSARAIRQF